MSATEKNKNKALEAFKIGDYRQAAKLLWEIGAVEFLNYSCNRNNRKRIYWFNNKEFADLFWKEFALQEQVWTGMIESGEIDFFLYLYYTESGVQSVAFETRLAKEHPEIFIKAVRTNHAFLQEDRVSLLCTVLLEDKYKIHQEVWQHFSSKELNTWREIDMHANKLDTVTPETILIECIIWMENSRLHNNEPLWMEHLSGVYNLFIQLLFKQYPGKWTTIKKEKNFLLDFIKACGEKIHQEENPKAAIIVQLLEKISAWVNLRDVFLWPYCYDLNTNPVQEQEQVLLCSSPEDFYKWQVNGARYKLNELRYRLRGMETTDALEEENTGYIPGATGELKEINRNLADVNHMISALLDDLHCNKIMINGNDIETNKLVVPLIGHSFNREFRYLNGLAKYYQLYHSFEKAFIQLSIEAVKNDISNDPYILMHAKEFYTLYKNVDSEFEENDMQVLLKFFTYAKDKADFDRFNLGFNVIKRPFIPIGDYYFCPVMFFAGNSWFYSFAQAALSQKAEREETRKMEQHLANMFSGKGWAVKSENEIMLRSGDIDIAVSDNDCSLLIQLKRTAFRPDLQAAYYEKITSDYKAAQQLNDALNSLKESSNSIEEKKKVTRWIVSTSFEQIGNHVNGCNKINYFDLLYTLQYCSIARLTDFIRFIEYDQPLFSFFENIKKHESKLAGMQFLDKLPDYFPRFETKEYRLPLFSTDDDFTKNYITQLNESFRLEKSGNREKAIELLTDCISRKPGDGEAYAAYAKIMADNHLFSEAFPLFEKALLLLPNDPHITRNYSIALMQSGDVYGGLKKLALLYHRYPLYDDLKAFFEKKYEQCLLKGSLNQTQVVELDQQWKNGC